MTIPNIHLLELHLTYRCTLACPNCLCQVSQAPAVDELPVETIEQLITDSIALAWPWWKIRLHGGEPILHSRFRDVCVLLADYWHRHNPAMEEIRVLTNGWGNHWREPMTFAESLGMTAGIAAKTPEAPEYVAVNMSPADSGFPGEECDAPRDCGIALNNRGFYPCSMAAGAARVLDHPPAATRLADVTVERMQESMAWCCRHCGFAHAPTKRTTVQETSPTWAAALERYDRNRKPTA